MTYNVTFNISSIPENIKVIIPISMGQKLETGEHLKALLDQLKTYKVNITLLICDGLNKFNVGEMVAQQQGNNYLEEHKIILEGINYIRWKDFIAEREILFKRKLEEITAKSQEDSLFYGKIIKTWKKCLSSQNKESSILYQRHEYAAILCMQEFDMLIYPKKITDGMAYLYGNFPDKKPVYNAAQIRSINENQLSISVNNKLGYSVLSSEKKPHMHVALRITLEQIEKLLESQEISNSSKQLFIEEFENLINVRYKPIISDVKMQEKTIEENSQDEAKERSPTIFVIAK